MPRRNAGNDADVPVWYLRAAGSRDGARTRRATSHNRTATGTPVGFASNVGEHLAVAPAAEIAKASVALSTS